MSESKLKKIGKYDVLDILGRGGMGVIYKAIDPAIGRSVAIKMITGAYSEDPDLLKRFYREAQSTGTLQHPNIVTVYELGDLEGTPYLVMEYLDGEGLDKLIAEKRPMPLVEKLAMGVQICHGLSYAHQKTVIHRDIKPANIIILRTGGIKIVDFGIARIGNDQLTKPGQVVGSIHYMSPEQVNAVAVDSRSDIFSTGVLLYELISYTLPFQGRDTFTTLMKILNQEAAPLDSLVPGLPPELNSVIQQALAKDRDLRYASIDDLAFDLNRLLDRLKEEIISGYLSAAEKSIQSSEWATAKEQIALIFRIDRQHTKANMLNREITAALQREQLQIQIREHRAVAEQAFSQNRYDEALASLDQALALRKTDPTIIRFRDSVEVARNNAIKLDDLLHRANAAQDTGDLEEATAAIDDALAIDPENSQAKALQSVVRRAKEEREKHRQVENFLEQGRKQMSARRFTAAIELLKKAEEIDPMAARVHELLNLALNNQEAERRRKELEEACNEVEQALNRDDYNAACAKAAQALEKFPDDRGLLKLKTLAEKQKELGERRIFVDAQVKASRRLLDQRKSADSATLLENALLKYPGDPALSSQLAMVREIITREREEERKSQFVHQAKEALLRKNFEDAIGILEKAQREIRSSEIDDLLQFTRDEAAAAARQGKINEIMEEAQRLINAEEYTPAAELLERSLAEFPDEELQMRLVDARHAAEEFALKVKDAIGTADRMVRARRTAEAIRYLEGMPASFSRTTQFRECEARTREEHSKLESFTAAKAEVRAAIDKSDFDRAFAAIDNSLTVCGEISEFGDLRREIESIRQTTANSEIERAVHDARLVLLVRSYDAALKVLEDGSAMLAHASPELRAQFESLKKDAQEGKQKQEREAKHREAATLSSEQISTRIVGSSSNTSIEDTHWSSAATATPIPQELTRLEAGIVRERDLLKVRDLLAKCNLASASDCEAIEQQTESLSEMYADDSEFQSIVSEILGRLAEIEKAAHTIATPVLPKEEELPSEEPAPVKTSEPPEIAKPLATSEMPSFPSGVAEKTESLTASPVVAPEAAISIENSTKTDSKPVASLKEHAETTASASPNGIVATPPVPASKKKPAKKQGRADRVIPPIPQKPVSKPSPVELPTAKPLGPVGLPIAKPGLPSRPSSFKSLYIGAAVLAAIVVIAVLVRAFSPHASSPTPSSSLPPSASNLVTVRVDSIPSGATIRVNDQSCKAPGCELKLAPGNYEIEAQLVGREITHQSLVVKSGEQDTSVTVRLAPAASSGDVATASKHPDVATQPTPAPPKRTTVEFFGLPPATAVKIDGKSLGQINDNGSMSVDVTPGTHNIELVQNGFKPLALRKTIGADRTVRLGPKELVFKPSPAVVAQKNPPPPPEPQTPLVANRTEAAAVVKAPPPAPDPAAAEWQKISTTRDQGTLSEFIRRFPNSPQAVDANRRLGQLRDEVARAAAEKASTEMAATRSAIQQTLGRYVQAYRDRDANAVTNVWPGLSKQDVKKIQESFKAASSIQMSLHPVSEPEVSGDVAQVICSRSLQFTFPHGVQKPLQDKVTVQMRKQNGLWVIEKIQ